MYLYSSPKLLVFLNIFQHFKFRTVQKTIFLFKLCKRAINYIFNTCYCILKRGKSEFYVTLSVSDSSSEADFSEWFHLRPRHSEHDKKTGIMKYRTCPSPWHTIWMMVNPIWEYSGYRVTLYTCFIYNKSKLLMQKKMYFFIIGIEYRKRK